MPSQIDTREAPPLKKQKISPAIAKLPQEAIDNPPSPKPLEKSKSKKSHPPPDAENAGKRKRTDDSEEPKSKKSKKKRVAEEEGDGDVDSRHRRLMEKREKSLKRAQKLAEKAAAEAAQTEEAPIEEPAEIHGLGPLPQPEPAPEPPVQSALSSLPPWLGSPIRVSPTITAPFSEIGVHKDVEKALQAHGFKEAFAVQAAVLPLLLPGPSREGDVLVSAATGSGKTLSYVLPMIENISQNIVTQLRGLIVMPTRELVSQAREVCNTCTDAFANGGKRRVKIGTAVGSDNFKAEQAALMDQQLRHDPTGYREQRKPLNAKWEASDVESDGEEDLLLCDGEDISPLPDHVIDHISKVDILICTPGRLVEHLKSTPGFTLQHIKWLVVDEADKLLDQSFQQWLNTVMECLERDVRKIILSATLTRDIGQLNGLKLHRPRLVVLESSEGDGTAEEGHTLPPLLVESAIKVDDSTIKPLYLLHLLRKENVATRTLKSRQAFKPADSPDDDSQSSSSSSSSGSSSSNSSSDSSSESSSESSSDSSSDSSSESSSESSSDESSTDDSDNSENESDELASAPSPRGVLIFTKSNETAVRLGRLIALVEPKYSELTGTLTSTTRSSTRKSTIASFNAGKLSILVASDLVSRGLDLPNLAHVVNYDIPTSVTNYVHRVGRTARAGKKGNAWTLFTDTEGRWFWNEIARSENIQRARGSKVERVNMKAEELFDNELRERYESALEELGREATSSKSDAPKHT
jgi:ATP-dependent RNA helicase DDX51/DBP6